MLPRRSRRLFSGHLWGIMLLAFGLGRVPLPIADYHAIRHQDGPSQTCRLHEHLEHWHPGAVAAESLPTLHWHWLPPLGVPDPNSSEGFRIDVHAADSILISQDEAPRITSIGLTKLLDRPQPPSYPAPSWDWRSVIGSQVSKADDSRPFLSFTSTFLPLTSLSPLLQIWTC